MKTTDNIAEARQAVEVGEQITERARRDFAMSELDGDNDEGPMLRKWRARNSGIPPRTSPAALVDHELINNIIAYLQAGRRISAAMAMVTLRNRYEMLEPFELPADERSWETFATKHVPLPPELVRELLGRAIHSGDRISCVKCGATSKAVCGCGAPYVGEHRWADPAPIKTETKLVRAAAALARDPRKSDRAIAVEIGVSHQTVKRAREKLAQAAGDVPADVTADVTAPIWCPGCSREVAGPCHHFDCPIGPHRRQQGD